VINLNGLLDTFVKYAANKYWLEWYSKNREHFNELVNKHKKSRRREFQALIEERKSIPCKRCGRHYHPAAMNLVHRDLKDKQFSLSNASRLIYSIQKLTDEMDKCDVYCANCIKTIQLEEFLKGGDGEEGSSKKRRRKTLREIIDKIKNKACGDCGKKFHPYIMELDHLDGHKKVDSISKMINQERPIKTILDELKKTEAICTNCHRIRTYERSHKSDYQFTQRTNAKRWKTF